MIIHAIDASNEKEIMAIMRSFSVCLSILLEANAEKHFGAYAQKLNTKAGIIHNIVFILSDNSLVEARKLFIQSLASNKTTFLTALYAAQSLMASSSSKSQVSVNDVMNALIAGENDFITPLYALLEAEKSKVKTICNNLITNQIPDANAMVQENKNDDGVAYGGTQSSEKKKNDDGVAYGGTQSSEKKKNDDKAYGNTPTNAPDDLEILAHRLRVNQVLLSEIGYVREGYVCTLKNEGMTFTDQEADRIWAVAQRRPGEDDGVKIFRGAIQVAFESSDVRKKLKTYQK